MGMASSFGQTELFLKELLKTGRNMKEYFVGQMETNIKDSSKIIRWTEKVNSFGRILDTMKAIGLII